LEATILDLQLPVLSGTVPDGTVGKNGQCDPANIAVAVEISFLGGLF